MDLKERYQIDLILHRYHHHLRQQNYYPFHHHLYLQKQVAKLHRDVQIEQYQLLDEGRTY